MEKGYKPSSVMRANWDIIAHDDHVIDAAEHNKIACMVIDFMESKGYCCGGHSAIGSIADLESYLSDSAAKIAQLEKAVELACHLACGHMYCEECPVYSVCSKGGGGHLEAHYLQKSKETGNG
jgi:hypothetical protein